MGTPVAVVVGSAIVAVAILFAFRWEVAMGSGTPPVIRLDRWTGKVAICNVDPDALAKAGRNHTAVEMDCVAP